MSRWAKMRALAATVKREVKVYRLVAKHPGTSRRARWLLGGALAYLVSPIDIIPDFIPVIGYLDDVVIVSLLVYLAMRAVPAEVVAECRKQVAEEESGRS
jgi:uncharacterized membrane protein YkvA (DUF1232 family)